MKYYWNDKEVSEEEYQEINERWKKRVEEEQKRLEAQEASEKKSRKRK